MILYFILVKYGIQVLLPWLQGTCIHLFVPTKSFASDDWKSLGINPNIVVCEDIGLKTLFAMYNHHNLAKENRSEQEILVAGTQFAQNNKHLFKELSHQNEHLQRKWATLPMYICYSSRYIKNQLLMPLLQHIRHSRKTMPKISWWKRTCCYLQRCTYNPGRPFDKFNDFFHHLASVVKETITPNEQQHLTAHLSQWITLGVRLDGKSYQKMHSKYTDSSKSTRVETAVCIQNMPKQHGHSH